MDTNRIDQRRWFEDLVTFRQAYEALVTHPVEIPLDGRDLVEVAIDIATKYEEENPA